MSQRKATLYRMKLPTHECPYGLEAKRLLDEAGFTIDEHLLTSREETEAFKEENGVDTTPRTVTRDPGSRQRRHGQATS